VEELLLTYDYKTYIINAILPSLLKLFFNWNAFRRF